MIDDALEKAYAHGDHLTARRLAYEIIREGADEARVKRAHEILRATRPDPFLIIVGLVGLCVLVWLVYKYLP